MRIFIIGKNGQIGRAIISSLKKQKQQVSAFSKDELDITRDSDVRNAIKKYNPDIVINASGYHVVADCEKYPDRAFEVNTSAVLNLARACNERKIRLVNFSTDRVFDGTKKVPYKEEDGPNPLQIYGISKLAGELVAHAYNSESITIRTCGVFGGKTGSSMKKGNFVLYILDQAKKNKEIEISSEQTASFANADDLAEGLIKLIELKAPAGIYHLINEGYGTWSEFAQEIVSQSKENLKIIPINRKGVYGDTRIPLFVPLLNTKAKKLGVVLPPWQDGLKRYLKFLKYI